MMGDNIETDLLREANQVLLERNRRLVEALDGELTTGFRPAQLQAIGEHLVTAVLVYFDKRARAL